MCHVIRILPITVGCFEQNALKTELQKSVVLPGSVQRRSHLCHRRGFMHELWIGTGSEKRHKHSQLCAMSPPPPPGGVLGSSFTAYVPLAPQNPYPIIAYFWPALWLNIDLNHFWGL